jgi:hypothetical protein
MQTEQDGSENKSHRWFLTMFPLGEPADLNAFNRHLFVLLGAFLWPNQQTFAT